MHQSSDESSLTIVSFNILAHGYLKKSPPSHLRPQQYSQEKRRVLLRRILDDRRFDIVCLQECDDYKAYWSNSFGKLGYRSCWDCRARKSEGLCMLFREDRVLLVSIERVELDDVIEFASSAELEKGRHKRSSVAQIAHFKVRKKQKKKKKTKFCFDWDDHRQLMGKSLFA
jgi:mRNA deadenylase 3'-5' endonuclease subunit Ccr4